MSKAPEEGRIWEWRAFGHVTKSLRTRVESYPIRFGFKDIRGEDLYLVAPQSDQNVKLRRYAFGWVLKFKMLLETRPGPFELYNESSEFTYTLPVPLVRLSDAARLLEVKLPQSAFSVTSFDEPEFVGALAKSSPPVVQARVSKKRSQYQFVNGWLELADIEFPRRSIQSISIHSADLEVVKEMIALLKPGDELEPMNYIEGCRRWR